MRVLPGTLFSLPPFGTMQLNLEVPLV